MTDSSGARALGPSHATPRHQGPQQHEMAGQCVDTVTAGSQTNGGYATQVFCRRRDGAVAYER